MAVNSPWGHIHGWAQNVRQCAAHLANQEKPNRLGWIYLWAKQDDLIDLDVIPPAELMDLTVRY